MCFDGMTTVTFLISTVQWPPMLPECEHVQHQAAALLRARISAAGLRTFLLHVLICMKSIFLCPNKRQHM